MPFRYVVPTSTTTASGPTCSAPTQPGTPRGHHQDLRLRRHRRQDRRFLNDTPSWSHSAPAASPTTASPPRCSARPRRLAVPRWAPRNNPATRSPPPPSPAPSSYARQTARRSRPSSAGPRPWPDRWRPRSPHRPPVPPAETPTGSRARSRRRSTPARARQCHLSLSRRATRPSPPARPRACSPAAPPARTLCADGSSPTRIIRSVSGPSTLSRSTRSFTAARSARDGPRPDQTSALLMRRLPQAPNPPRHQPHHALQVPWPVRPAIQHEPRSGLSTPGSPARSSRISGSPSAPTPPPLPRR